MNLSLVVLAAGMGSRYGGLKQLDPVGPGGEVILDYSVFDAVRAGFNRVVFIIRRDIEQAFRERIGRRLESSVRVDYVTQEVADLPDGFTAPADRVKPWGTGHAILSCARVVKEPFAVITADDFYGRQPFEIMARFLGETAGVPDEYAMVGYILRNTLSEHGSVARGICGVGPDRHLQSVVETTKIERAGISLRGIAGEHLTELTGEELTSMSLWGFKPSVFAFLDRDFRAFLKDNIGRPGAEFYAPSVVNGLIAEGAARVTVLPTTSRWYGITYQADKPGVVDHVAELIAACEYPARLWAS